MTWLFYFLPTENRNTWRMKISTHRSSYQTARTGTSRKHIKRYHRQTIGADCFGNTRTTHATTEQITENGTSVNLVTILFRDSNGRLAQTSRQLYKHIKSNCQHATRGAIALLPCLSPSTDINHDAHTTHKRRGTTRWPVIGGACELIMITGWEKITTLELQ